MVIWPRDDHDRDPGRALPQGQVESRRTRANAQGAGDRGPAGEARGRERSGRRRRARVDAGLRQAPEAAHGNEAHPGESRRSLRGHRARGSNLILDTHALSAFVDGDAGVGEALRREARAAIPVIVLGEFRYGIAESRHRAAYEAWLDTHVS